MSSSLAAASFSVSSAQSSESVSTFGENDPRSYFNREVLKFFQGLSRRPALLNDSARIKQVLQGLVTLYLKEISWREKITPKKIKKTVHHQCSNPKCKKAALFSGAKAQISCKCNNVFYCSFRCRDAHWGYHKDDCKEKLVV